MKIIIQLLSIHLLLIISLTIHSQVPYSYDLQEQNIQDHILYLASDSLRGRGIDSPELELASSYIREELRLKEVSPPSGGYFQEFPLVSRSLNSNESFIKVMNNRKHKKKAIREFIPYKQTSDIADITGQLVFAGFGSESSLTDEKGISINDFSEKIVLISAGTPQAFKGKRAFRFNTAFEDKKLESLIHAGAKAVILVTSIHDTMHNSFRILQRASARMKIPLQEKEPVDQIQVFIVTPSTAEELTGNDFSWAEALKLVSEDNSPTIHPQKINNIHIRSVQPETTIHARNVLGVLEGSDSLLKEECIVFMAHYDHLGTSGKGSVYNGADDNASGVAALLEVAGMFASSSKKPGRSLLFLYPSGEEIGLFGSGYYSRNPVFPLNKTVACINLDMVGRVYEESDSVWKDSPKMVKDFDGIYTLVNNIRPELKTLTEKTCRELELEPDFSLPVQFFNTSDHYHFHKNQVPVLNISTGYSADYHKPTDTSDRIRPDKIKRIAELCYLLGIELANEELPD